MDPYELLIASILRDLKPRLTKQQFTLLTLTFVPLLHRKNRDFDGQVFIRYICLKGRNLNDLEAP